MDYATQAAQVATDARRQIRDEFQKNHPHYTPPPGDASEPTWMAWLDANLRMHGARGMVERGLDRIVMPAKVFEMLEANLR